MAEMDKDDLLDKLKQALTHVDGTAKASIEYKIALLEGPQIYSYTTNNVLVRSLFEDQIKVERRLLGGYTHIQNELINPAVGMLIEFSKKKLYFYEKIKRTEFTGSYSECAKISGRLTFTLEKKEIDPCNQAEFLSFYINREHRKDLSLNTLQSVVTLELESSSLLEIILLDKDLKIFYGLMMMPTAFFVERAGQVLPLSYDTFNLVWLKPEFKITNELIRERLERKLIVIAGHVIEKQNQHSLFYCTLCSKRCPLIGTICVCLQCHLKAHVGCLDFLRFACRCAPIRTEDSYKIAHQLERSSSSGTHYCSHCGERIGLGSPLMRCKVCSKPFHESCTPFLFETCGLSLELLKKMSELEALRAFQAGTEPVRITDFELLGTLGRGALSRVVAARHKKDGKLLAIKAFPRHMVRNYRLLNYIKNEINVLKRIRDFKHPFLNEMYFSFEDNYYFYIALKYHSGGDLHLSLSRFRPSEQQIRLYVAEIILALEHLHRNGIIHRDLKLENVLLSSKGHVRLCDFGSARLGMSYGEETHSYCGTLEIAAPEVITGKGYSFSADFWSLGIVAYELFHASSPFAGGSTRELVNSICAADVEISAEISEEGKDFIVRLLSRNLEDRLGSGLYGSEELKEHPWFSGLDWDAVAREEIVPEPMQRERPTWTGDTTRLTPVIAVPDIKEYIKNIKKEEEKKRQ